MTDTNQEKAIAKMMHDELKQQMVKVLWDFTDKHATPENRELAPCFIETLTNVMHELTNEVEAITHQVAPFSNLQQEALKND